MAQVLAAPFPYFGGKRRAAHAAKQRDWSRRAREAS